MYGRNTTGDGRVAYFIINGAWLNCADKRSADDEYDNNAANAELGGDNDDNEVSRLLGADITTDVAP